MDEGILRSLNALAESPLLATLSVLLSSRWLIVCVCAPLALSLVKQKKWIAIASIAFAMGGADLVGARVIKPLVARERPCRAVPDLVKPVSCGPGRSFPSNHSAIGFAFLISAAPLFRFGWATFTPLAIGIALSRVVLGVHYPSDVAAGAVLGSMIGAAMWLARRKWEARTSSRPASTSP